MSLESKALLSSDENSNRHKTSFFNARGLKLGHYDFLDMLFPFLAFLKL